MDIDEFLTTHEIASLLKINIMTVRRWIGKGILPATDLGKEYRIKKSDFEAFLNDRTIRKRGRKK